MNGIVIWAHSECRSTMALYREIRAMAGVPVIITLWHYADYQDRTDARSCAGFRPDEFADLNPLPIGDDYERGLEILKKSDGWLHLFCEYQESSVYRNLILEAKRRGNIVGIVSESPCNMFSGSKYMVKKIYLSTVLPFKLQKVISVCDFFVNLSGNCVSSALQLGWPKQKIIPFGYYPDPIKGSRRILRHWQQRFHVLSTGVLSRYRGADVLVDALVFLKRAGVDVCATITQEGELLHGIRKRAEVESLDISFPGFVKIPELLDLYETCSVYVGAGRREPWGMRLNDALNCGAPLLISSGMGGSKLVTDGNCGLVFESGNAVDLAQKIALLIDCPARYDELAQNAFDAADEISPQVKAKELLALIRSRIYE